MARPDLTQRPRTPPRAPALYGEPWSHIRDSSTGRTLYETGNPRAIGAVYDYDASGRSGSDAYAARVVACVNACAGIPTSVLTRPSSSPYLAGVGALLFDARAHITDDTARSIIAQIADDLLGPYERDQYGAYERGRVIPPLDFDTASFGDEPWRAFAKGGVLEGFADVAEDDPAVARIADSVGACDYNGVLEDGRYAAFDVVEEDAVIYVETAESRIERSR